MFGGEQKRKRRRKRKEGRREKKEESEQKVTESVWGWLPKLVIPVFGGRGRGLRS